MLVISLPAFSPAQGRGTFSDSIAVAFIRHLALDSDSLNSDIDPSGVRLAGRLGIVYQGVRCKALISYAPDRKVSSLIIGGSYEYRVDPLEDGFSRLNLSVPPVNFKASYFFKDQKLVSPMTYYSRHWKRYASRFFVFVVSDTDMINEYTRTTLDNFVERMGRTLRLDDSAIDKLNKEKIYYYLCSGQDEIEELSGFRTRGIFNIAYDCIISTYPCHFHELLHLLMNYKLHNLPLYTTPFLQEGFAVAFGGRGGLDPGPVLDAGIYLEKSGIADFKDLLSKDDFTSCDPSISYPIAGLYSRFLVGTIGMEEYIDLYERYSGTADYVDSLKIDTALFPPGSEWKHFLDVMEAERAIRIGEKHERIKRIYSAAEAEVSTNNSRYFFLVRDTLLVSAAASRGISRSDKFSELFPSRKYCGEKYAVIADSSGVSVYNLFTGNLVAAYVMSFSIPPVTVPKKNGLFGFSAPVDLFDEPPDKLTFH